MDYIIPALIVVIALVAVGWWIRHALVQALRKEPEASALQLLLTQFNLGSTQTAQQMEGLQKGVRDELRVLQEQVHRALAESNRTVGERLDGAAQVIGDLRQRLGQMDEASKRIFEVGKDIAELQQTLQAPKLRGELGEYLLTDLLAQVLPENAYATQYVFKGGEKVDAVIKLSLGMVAVDAKFPLENFKRVVAAAGDDEKAAAGKAFIRDVKKHIDDIAGKYIRPDEGTFDFALMYIPAENVYYEIVVKSEWSGDQPLFPYALKKRVIPVSPNSFYAYLQTILLGLRGLRVEESAREIMDHLARLKKDLDVFLDDFRLVGQHLDNAAKKYTDAEKRLDKVEDKIALMGGLTPALPPGEKSVGETAVEKPAL